MSRGYPDGKNPFFCEEDDSVGFRGAGMASSGHREISDEDFARPVPTKAEQLQQLKEQSMNRQLESTQRALASIYDSERMGVATAEELLHQGEQLDNIETKTDTINEDMKTTQKHLNSIKSVFGGIKNWWSRGSKEEEKEPPSQRQSRLRNTVDAQRDTECEHPAMRLRAEDVRGFYEDDSGYSRGAQQQQQEQRQYSGAMAAHEETFHQNLDLMSDGMSRLKGLALGLGDEIEAQNEQIDRINSKVDKADVSIQDKNRQMRQILGIKGKK